MKITGMSLTLFPWEGLQGLSDAAYGSGFGEVQLGLLRIHTDEGVEGNAFLGSSVCPATADAGSLMEALPPVLLGQDPLLRGELYRRLDDWRQRRRTTRRAVGAVDIALWDLAGKKAGLPLYRLIGGCREEVAAYASSQSLPGVKDYTEEVLRCKEEGWKGYKIHPPARDWREDIAVCRAVRTAAGEEYPLMLDSMWSYDYAGALQAGRSLEELRYEWFEDPLPENDVASYQKLCQKLDIPVMATEYPGYGVQGYVPWLLQGASDYLRGDVAVKGGLTPVLGAAKLAEAFGMEFAIHHGANSLNNVANLHAALAIPNCRWYEVMLPECGQRFGLLDEPRPDKNGMVAAPKAPGLGAKIDRERIGRTATATLRAGKC